MKRPLVPVAIAFCLGLVLAEYFHPPFWYTLLFTGTLLAVAVVVSRLRAHLILPLALLTGAVCFLGAAGVQAPDDLRSQFASEPVIVTLRGTLTSHPELRSYDSPVSAPIPFSTSARAASSPPPQSERLREPAARPALRQRTLSRLSVEGFSRPQLNFTPASGTVLVTTPGALPNALSTGSRVEVTGVLSRPPGPDAAGLFDYRNYLSHQNIHFQLRAGGTNDWHIVSPCAPGAGQRFMNWARHCLARGLPEEDQPLLLLRSMALGARSTLEKEDYEPFLRTGTMHIFAISGLHIALIAGLLVGALRLARFPRGWCGLIALPLIWFYTAATGWQPSAVRAALMSSVVIFGWAICRPSDLVNSLCAAGLLILAVDPQQIFGASFQLSFFVVLSIALMLPRLENVRDRLLQHDPLLAPECVSLWRRCWLVPARWVTSSIAISAAAWLGVLPLTLSYFHLFNPISLFANLVIVPLSSLALGCNLLSFLCGDWLVPCTEAFNNAAWFFMWCILELSDWMASFRWGAVYVNALSTEGTLLYYAVLLGVFSGWLTHASRRWWAMAGVPVLCVCCTFWTLHDQPSGIVSVLAGNGSLALHSRVNGKDLLIDCGHMRASEKMVTPFLHSRGVGTLDGLVLTHGDLNHVGGAEVIENEFRPAFVAASPLKFRSAAYKACMTEFEQRGKLRRVTLADNIGAWKVLHPEKIDTFSLADDGAMVLMAEIKGIRILLLSDLARSGQEALMERVPDLRADVVVTSLPSRGEPLSDALLAKIDPIVVIVADSASPSFDHVKPATLKRLRGLETETSEAAVLANEAAKALDQPAVAHPERAPGYVVYCCSQVGIVEVIVGRKGRFKLRMGSDFQSDPLKAPLEFTVRR